MTPSNHRAKRASDYAEDKYVGTIGPMRCHVCKLRGDSLTDADSNWKLWNADMKVYRDGAGKGREPGDVFASLDEEILTMMERRRKAILWFSISEKLREQHLSDMGGRDKTSEDVFRRIHERVAPEGTPYESLDTLVVTDHMREEVRILRENEKK